METPDVERPFFSLRHRTVTEKDFTFLVMPVLLRGREGGIGIENLPVQAYLPAAKLLNCFRYISFAMLQASKCDEKTNIV